MKLSRLRAVIRETWNGDSPLWNIVCWYGILSACYASPAAFGMFRAASLFLTGRSSPFPPLKSALIVGFVLFGLVGAACGLCVGRFVNSVATDHPKMAFPLLFVVQLVPPACILAVWTMAQIAANQGVGRPLAYLEVVVAGCAINCYRWRRKGWPGSLRKE